MRFDLSDEEWTTIKPYLPQGGRGPKRVDDRRVLNGIFYILRTGHRGVIYQDATALEPRFTTVMLVGQGVAFGNQFLMPLPVKTRTVCSLSIALS